MGGCLLLYLVPTIISLFEYISLVYWSYLEDIALGHCNFWRVMKKKLRFEFLKTLFKIYRYAFGGTGEQWR